MNKKIIVLTLASLLIGGGIGYAVKGDTSSDTPENSTESATMGSHDMSGQSTMASTLVGKSGEDLDVAFLEGMIVHHQDAVDMATMVLAKTKRPELKQLSQDIITTQTKEITTMNEWLRSWYGR